MRIMITLQQHLEELDRMIANHATTAEIRSQAAFIAREVAALEADYSRVFEAYAELEDKHAKLKEAQSAKNDRAWDEIRKESEKQKELLRSKQLNYKV